MVQYCLIGGSRYKYTIIGGTVYYFHPDSCENIITLLSTLAFEKLMGVSTNDRILL